MSIGRYLIDAPFLGTANTLGDALNLVNARILQAQSESGYSAPFSISPEITYREDKTVSLFGFLMGEQPDA